MRQAAGPDDRLRVLIAAESFLPSVNGVTNSVVRTAQHLRRRGHQPVIVAPEPGSDTLDDIPVMRVASRAMPFYRGLPVGTPSAATVEGLLDDVRPDVVHLAAPAVLGSQVAKAAAARDLPVVAVFQTDLAGFAQSYHLSPLSPVVWWWLRRIHRQVDVTLAPSRATAGQLHAHGFPRVGVWPRGVDRELFAPTRRADSFRRSVLGADADTVPLVGYVGRLAREKRVELLADLGRRTDLQLVIVGDGPHRDELQRTLPRAHFTGMLRGTELAEAVASLDVFVHTGAHETFGQTIQEAMASGVPVVAPAAGGPLDLVVPDETGYLYPPGDRAELSVAVDRLLSDAGRRRTFSQAARARTAQRGWDRLGDDLIATYQRCRRLRAVPQPVAATGPIGLA
ncbi:MAG: glycosyltransferase family 1 protein, partial [Actinomycetota bacterium]